jgi:two-component system, NarL family, sensor kinase
LHEQANAGPAAATAPAEPTDPMREIVDRVRHITRENERLFERLIAGERRFRSLAKAVWKVQEEERRRLARELHDGLGQTLTALTHQLELLQRKLDPHPAGDAGGRGDSGDAGNVGDLAVRLADSVELARLALNESRELSRLLRPPVLDDLGLPAALSWLARTLEQRTGLRVELSLAGIDGRLDADLETLVFRLVQEALTNVLRHSGVDRAAVGLRRAGDSLELQVSDSGRGFDSESTLAGAAAERSSGLHGMRDRLELFGGRLDLVSRLDAGTRLTATIPVLEPAEPPETREEP